MNCSDDCSCGSKKAGCKNKVCTENKNHVDRSKSATSSDQLAILDRTVSNSDFTNAQAFFVSACEEARSEDIKLVN